MGTEMTGWSLLWVLVTFVSVSRIEGSHYNSVSLSGTNNHTVIRYSNLYGTVVSCLDYLVLSAGSDSTSSIIGDGQHHYHQQHHRSHLASNEAAFSAYPLASNGPSHRPYLQRVLAPPLPPQSLPQSSQWSRLFSTINRLQYNSDLLFANYHNDAAHNEFGINLDGLNYNSNDATGNKFDFVFSLLNATFEWQVRSANQYRSASSSSSSLSALSSSSSASSSASSSWSSLFASRADRYGKTTDQAANQHRYANKNDGTLSLTPFDSEHFVPDIHDAYYRCLVRLPLGTLVSRELHLQAVVEPQQFKTGSSSSSAKLKSFESTLSDDKQTLDSVRTLNSSEIFEQNDAILRCDFGRFRTLFKVNAWQRDDGKIYLPIETLVNALTRIASYSRETTFVNYTNIRHVILPNSGDLLVSSVSYRDSKHKYRCQVRHLVTNALFYSSNWGYIRLKDINRGHHQVSASLNVQLQTRHTVAADVGESAFFFCSFDGFPMPTIEWHHTNLKGVTQTSSLSSKNVIDSNNAQSVWSASEYLFGKNFLTIGKVNLQDTGIVSCVANNSMSIVRHEMFLFVKSSIQVSLQASNKNPYPGQDITLSCNLSTNIDAYGILTKQDDAQPNQSKSNEEQRLRKLISEHFLLNIVWYHNGQLVLFDNRRRRVTDDQLVIRDFRAPEDNGFYQCSIRLTAPDYDEESFMSAVYIRSVEKTPQLTHVFSEQVKLADQSEPLSLRCSAQGAPLPSIRWYLDGTELRSNGHVQIDSFVESKDEAHLSLKKSSVPVSLSSTTDEVKESAKYLSQTITSYLNISTFFTKDIGMYQCKAETYVGTAEHQARINQMGTPFVKPIANQTAVLGQPFTLNCTYGGYPIEEVYFTKGLRQSGGNENDDSEQVGKRLPFDERHLVPRLGSLTINPVEKSDEDYYYCVATNAAGHRTEQKFYLDVVVAPVISPIIFSDNLEEGMRGSAMCTVTSGDAPIQITWLKDGSPLRTPHLLSHRNKLTDSNHIQIVSIKDFMSSLIIDRISRHHEGTYTCVASSPVAVSNVSAFLSVRAVPQWRLKPADQHAVVGQSLTLDCQTSGQPSPVTRWKFVKNEAYPNDPTPILSSQQIHVLENGSLYLRSVEPKHSGVYICDSSNGINKSPIEARCRVTVSNLPKVFIQNTLNRGNGGHLTTFSLASSSARQSSPEYPSQFNGTKYKKNVEQIVLRKGAETQLLCAAVGVDRPMTAQWLLPVESLMLEDRQHNRYQEARVTLREESKPNEKRVYLYISHVTREDSGVYTCVATNVHGHSVSATELVVQEPPDMPQDFGVLEIASRTIKLSWMPGHSGNLPIKSYVVEYWQSRTNTQADIKDNLVPNEKVNQIFEKSSTSNENLSVLTAKSFTNGITITGLKPLTTYKFRVCAYNELGASSFTNPIELHTEMEAPSVVPQDLRITVINSRTIKLVWSIMLLSPNTETIDGFYIGYRPVQTTSNSVDGKMADNVPSQMSYYTFKTMQDLSGTFKNNISVDQPYNLSTSLDTYCEVVNNNGAQLKSADLAKSLGSSVDFEDKLEKISCTYNYLVSQLKRKTRYGFIVQTFNSKGAGPISSEVFAQTLAKDPPGKVKLALHNVSSYEALLTWTVPIASNNEFNDYDGDSEDLEKGANIDGYIISFRPLIRTAIWLDDQVTEESNKEGIFLQQQKGEIKFQNSRNKNKMTFESDSPVQSTETSNDKYEQTNWQTISVSERVTAYVLRNLRCGTVYRVQVEAFNQMGSGEASDLLEFSTIGKVPIAPKTDAFIKVNVTWVMLDLDRWNNGLCPITHYGIRYRVKHDSLIKSLNPPKPTRKESDWITVSSHIKPEHGSMYVIQELEPATWFELSIIASNEAGQTESRYMFATLTVTGATVEPLYSTDGFNRRHFGSMIGGVITSENLLEDPMILIPATCAVLVLLVVGAATAFIFITRSKDTLANTEHFCRHRDNTRSDQLSLNSFVKNPSKSDLIRSYADSVDPSKIGSTIETFNCGAADNYSNEAVQSQYVQGPTSMPLVGCSENKGSHVDTLSPSIRHKASNTLQKTPFQPFKQDGFYMTPCNQQTSQSLNQNLNFVTNYEKQTLGIGPQGFNLTQQTSEDNKNEHFKQMESLYGELSGHQPSLHSDSLLNQFEPKTCHPYYTHSQFNMTMNHPKMAADCSKTVNDSTHIYELPKQPTFGQTNQDGDLLIMMMQPKQTQSNGSSLKVSKQSKPSPQKNKRLEQFVPNLTNFHQNF